MLYDDKENLEIYKIISILSSLFMVNIEYITECEQHIIM